MYVDFAQGNIPGVLDAMSDDVVIDTPGPDVLPVTGVWKGKSGALDFFQSVGATSTYDQFEALDLFADGDKVAALGHAAFTSPVTGKKGTSRWVMLWTLKDGKAIHVVNQWDTYAIAQTIQ